MRPLVLPVSALAVALLAGCGDEPADGPVDPAPSSTSASAAAGVDVLSAEVSTVAPALESFYRGQDSYPTTLDDAVASLAAAGVTLAPGHEVGSYVYDADAVEFVLCLQEDDGAWASYDTAPMGIRDAGGSGGCPEG